MANEHSAGAVVYTVKDGVRHFALVVEKNGDCGLPKGHLEKGETERQAALREIREELGVAVDPADCTAVYSKNLAIGHYFMRLYRRYFWQPQVR